MNHIEKLVAIRDLMKRQRIDAYIIPSSDPHISEYLPDRFKCIAWASGFTGSAGTLVITADFAGLWTDARYFVQAAEQLAGSGYSLMKLNVQHAPEYAGWLSENLAKGAVVAFDGMLASLALARTIQDILLPIGIAVDGQVDLLSPLWHDRPALPTATAYLIDEKTTGESAVSKLSRLRGEMAKQHVEACLISSLDDLAWLFNIRGNDVACNPVVLGFTLVTHSEATLFIDQTKLAPEDQTELAAMDVVLAGYETLAHVLRQLPEHTSILIDPRRTCFDTYRQLAPSVNVVERTNPTTTFKAVKNDVELAHTRSAMINDGVALTRFFKWLESAIGHEHLSEISIAGRLRQFRAEQVGFVGESFDTIAGYRAHGALPHYKATPQSDSMLEARGLLLIDSGGQYLTGTTDITRVISLGEITPGEQMDYTLVLKGMIEGSTTIFPKGTRGYQIDALTRKPLWDHLCNYGHGTGHGVGFFLNVHEGPHVFNTAAVDVPIENGMITSIEPGLYREGAYGIRIENLVASVADQLTEFGAFMAFETLTLCYIDTRLIDRSFLERKHVDWLNAYHKTVYERLAPYLTGAEQQWLEEKTKAI